MKYYDNLLTLKKYQRRIDLYFDCDGVILNTIKKAREIAIEQGINPNNYEEFHDFFVAKDENGRSKLDWHKLIPLAGEIDNAIAKIKAIQKTGKYNVYILTKLSGNETEEMAKRAFFEEFLPGVPIITVRFRSHKDEQVNPVGSILIEDSLANFRRWRMANGVSILFLKGEYIHDYPDELPISVEERLHVVDNIANFEKTVGVQELLKQKEEQQEKELLKVKSIKNRYSKLIRTRQY